MIEHIEGAGNVDFQCRGNVLRLFFLLVSEKVIQILQNWHILRAGVIEVIVVNKPYTTVDDGLLHRLQALFTTHNQLAQ